MGLLKVPKTYNPKGPAPEEHLAYLNKSEMKGLLARGGRKRPAYHAGLPSFPPVSSSGAGPSTGPGTSRTSNQSATGFGGTSGSGNNGPQNRSNPGGSGPQGGGGNTSSRGGTTGGGFFGGINTNKVSTNSKTSTNSFGPSGNNNNSFFGGINTNGTRTNSLNSTNSFGSNQSNNVPQNNFFGGLNTNQVKTLLGKAIDRYNAPGQIKYPSGAFNDNARQLQFGGYPVSYNPMQGPNLVNQVPVASVRTDRAPIGTNLIRQSDLDAGAAIRAPISFPTKQSYPVDPSMPGRLVEANRPGAGVPDLPTYGQEFAKTPGVPAWQSNPPAPQPQLGNASELLGGLTSGWPDTPIADPRLSYPSEEGQIYAPANLDLYSPQPKQFTDRVPAQQPTAYQSPIDNPGERLQNYLTEQQAVLTGSRRGVPQQPAQASTGLTYGPETPPGPADWQQGSLSVDPMAYSEPTRIAAGTLTSPYNVQPTQSWIDSIPGVSAIKSTYNAIDQNLIQPTQEQIAKYGGFERAGKLAQMAVGIMNFLPGGEGLKNTSGQNRDRLGAAGDVMVNDNNVNDVMDRQRNRGGAPSNPVPPVVPPVTPPPGGGGPPVQPWFYPPYTQMWAGLPVGQG